VHVTNPPKFPIVLPRRMLVDPGDGGAPIEIGAETKISIVVDLPPAKDCEHNTTQRIGLEYLWCCNCGSLKKAGGPWQRPAVGKK
jgi:hypothetical protein